MINPWANGPLGSVLKGSVIEGWVGDAEGEGLDVSVDVVVKLAVGTDVLDGVAELTARGRTRFCRVGQLNAVRITALINNKTRPCLKEIVTRCGFA